MRRKLQTKRGRQRYALRMQTVEPVFGQIKQGRGFRQFLLRGLEKVSGEWSLICTGHNLLKLFRRLSRLPKCPEHRQGGQHSEAYETIGPSVAAPGNNNCRRLTSPVPKARQSILRRAASTASRPLARTPATPIVPSPSTEAGQSLPRTRYGDGGGTPAHTCSTLC